MVFDLLIADLHIKHDISKALGDMLCEAASVCLIRHHISPTNMTLEIAGDPERHLCQLTWAAPSPIAQRSHAEEKNATESGAYAVILATIEAYYGLIAVGRARHGSGADYLLKPGPLQMPEVFPPDYENAVRLEVSGVDLGSPALVERRLREKVAQVRNGDSDSPALAGVVGFSASLIAVEGVEAEK